MRAVNLMPGDARSSRSVRLPKLAVPTYGLIALLVGAIVLVALYVTGSNSVADKKAQLATLQTELSQAQQAASRLAAYGQFAALEQQRVQSVRGIAATRFDWNSALGELAAVIPPNTSLTTLSGGVAPGANAGGSGSASGLRSALTGPAFEIQGCTANQDDVARLISRLRAMTSVQRVALSSSSKAAQSAGGGSVATNAKRGCPSTWPTFDLIVFYTPIQGAGAQGVTALGTTSTTTPNGGTK